MNQTVVLLIILLVIVLGLGGYAALRCQRWVDACRRRLAAGSKLMKTPLGRIEYKIWGSGGPIILLVHGTPGGYDQGQLLGEAAAQDGFWLISVSRPGYLRTPLSAGETPAEQADALAALLDGLGIARVAVVALSGGGPAAIQFALRHTNRCLALVAVSAVSRRIPPARKRFAGWLLSNRFFTSNFGGWLIGGAVKLSPALLARVLVPDAGIRARVMDDPRKFAALVSIAGAAIQLPAQRRAGMRCDNRQFASLPVFPVETLAVPVLAIHGTADENVPFEHARFLARAPGAELAPVEGGTHAVFMTHIDQVIPRILAFVRAHARR